MIAGFKRRFHAPMLLWLTLMWIMLNGEFSWGNLVAGLLIGSGVILFLPLPKPPLPDPKRINWRLLIRYLFQWLLNLIKASYQVAWVAVRPQEPPQAAIVNAPMRVENELVLTFAIALYNLQPGGSVTDVDIANRMWTCHLLRAGTPEDLEREMKAIADLERAMIQIFESR